MATEGFLDYRNGVFRCYGESRYSEALALAREAAAKFPDYEAKTSFWIACLQSRLGEHDEALQTLQEAVKRNVWWPAEVLRDSDLDPIRNKKDFMTIEAQSARLRREQANKTAFPDLMVRVPEGYSERKDWPALMVFHQRYGERPLFDKRT